MNSQSEEFLLCNLLLRLDGRFANWEFVREL